MTKHLFNFLLAILLFGGIALSANTAEKTVSPASDQTSSVPGQPDSGELRSKLPPLVIPPDLDEENSETLIDRIKDSFYTNFITDYRWAYLLDGFFVTVQISIAATILGVIIGFMVAVIRNISDQTGQLKVLNLFCKIYLTVIRGTPMVVQLLIIYFVIFASWDVDKVYVAIIAFGVNSGAYVTEIIRSGICSVDPGQLEAGRSLGLTYLQTMRLVILPQAFKNVLPALGNEFISLLKETSVAGYIALQDLTKAGDIIRSQTYDAFLPLTAVALTYLVIVMLFTWLLGKLERRLKRNER